MSSCFTLAEVWYIESISSNSKGHKFSCRCLVVWDRQGSVASLASDGSCKALFEMAYMLGGGGA